jgi:hypothetical protein
MSIVGVDIICDNVINLSSQWTQRKKASVSSSKVFFFELAKYLRVVQSLNELLVLPTNIGLALQA